MYLNKKQNNCPYIKFQISNLFYPILTKLVDNVITPELDILKIE